MRPNRTWIVLTAILLGSTTLSSAQNNKEPTVKPGPPKLDSSTCAGLAYWRNALPVCPPRQTAYIHVCFGKDGVNGTKDFRIPYGTHWEEHVQQFSTFTLTCGSATYKSDCPASSYTQIIRCEA